MSTIDPSPSNEPTRREYAWLIAIGLVASAAGIALGLLIDWFPVQASREADTVDTVWDVLIIASVPFFVLVTVVVLYSVMRFRMKPGEEEKDGPPIHGSTKIEVIWTTIPALVLLGLCTYAWTSLRDIEKAGAAGTELEVRVVGEQFAWSFNYRAPNGKQVTATRLVLPKDKRVRFTVQSKDVIHDFWVPEFRMKIDAVPGISTYYRITPIRLGTYPVVCAELCGLGHSAMRANVRVVEQQEFDRWLTRESAEKAS